MCDICERLRNKQFDQCDSVFTVQGEAVGADGVPVLAIVMKGKDDALHVVHLDMMNAGAFALQIADSMAMILAGVDIREEIRQIDAARSDASKAGPSKAPN